MKTTKAKKLTKPQMKQKLYITLLKIGSGTLVHKETKEPFTLEEWKNTEYFEKYKEVMAEYNFSRRSIYDSLVCNNYGILNEEKLKEIHDFVYKYL